MEIYERISNVGELIVKRLNSKRSIFDDEAYDYESDGEGKLLILKTTLKYRGLLEKSSVLDKPVDYGSEDIPERDQVMLLDFNEGEVKMTPLKHYQGESKYLIGSVLEEKVIDVDDFLIGQSCNDESDDYKTFLELSKP